MAGRARPSREKKLAFIAWYKERSGCVRCGRQYPSYVMDFAHYEGENKHGNISDSVYDWSWERMFAEISKSAVACSNCHREMTHGKEVTLPTEKQPRRSAQDVQEMFASWEETTWNQ